jgi:DNA primase
MADSEEYKAYRQKLDTLQRVASTMAKDLRSKPGEKVLQYLKVVRGYDDAFIDFASFGYVSRQSADELRKVFAYQTAEGERNALPYDVGEAYTLAIPYHSGGNIKGFAFRTIREDVKPKYKDAFLSGRESKKYHLFGLSGLRLTGNAEKDRDIVVVEGEIDALRAQYSGISNVVAASGERYPPRPYSRHRSGE